MKELLVSGESLPLAYHEALKALHDYGEVCDCADYNTRQKECSMTMVVEKPLSEPLISRLFIGGAKELQQYRREMLDGILDFEIEKGNWAYTYHSRMAEQIPLVINDLKRNPSSRRAVIDIRDWHHDFAPGNENPACLQHIQFFIREGALHCRVLFRSNDACKATFMNAFALICLQDRIARELGVELGTYSHRANSFHCYEKDFPMLEGYVRRIAAADDIDDLTYSYEEDWKEMMLGADPEIDEMIEELKNR